MKETPLIRISILLTMSILTATYSYEWMGTSQWLILSFLFLCVSLLTRKVVYSQCLSLYLCLFFMGCVITSHQMDTNRQPVEYATRQELSSLERTRLKVADFRKNLEKKMKDHHIEEQDYAVISAMALGDKAALDKTTKDSYSVAGASHVLAVSGLHIGIIFQFILLLLGGKKRSWLTVCLSTMAIWAYVLFIGMPASAVRSALLISIYGFGLLARRQSMSLNTLALAYIIMLSLNPSSLYDISFQMSFLAVLSILLFYPLLSALLAPSHRIGRWAWQLLCVSASAQIGTFPLVAYYFGRISCYGLLTSFIAIPAATLILYLCALFLLLAPFTFIGSLGSIVDVLIRGVTSILVGITQFINTAFRLVALLPGASIEGVRLNWVQLCLLYLIAFAGYLFWKNYTTFSPFLSPNTRKCRNFAQN